MRPDLYDIGPHAVASFDWMMAVHGAHTREIIRQYRAMREIAPEAFRDLELFAFGRESTWSNEDPHGREHARREGMRLVWLRTDTLTRLEEWEIDKLEEAYHGRRANERAGSSAGDRRTRESYERHIAEQRRNDEPAGGE